MSDKHFIKAFSKCCDAEVVCVPEVRHYVCTYCFSYIEEDCKEAELNWVKFVKGEQNDE